MKRILRLFIVAIICNSLIFLPLVSTYAAEGLALPAGDLIAPEIKSPPITKKIPPGERATIHATVTDNIGVKNVTIFYRNMGAIDFKRTEMMRELGTKDEYMATLPEIAAPGIEYYIQATDNAGNTILHGHTFSPLTLTVLSPGESPQQGQSAMATAPQERPVPWPLRVTGIRFSLAKLRIFDTCMVFWTFTTTSGKALKWVETSSCEY